MRGIGAESWIMTEWILFYLETVLVSAMAANTIKFILKVSHRASIKTKEGNWGSQLGGQGEIFGNKRRRKNYMVKNSLPGPRPSFTWFMTAKTLSPDLTTVIPKMLWNLIVRNIESPQLSIPLSNFLEHRCGSSRFVCASHCLWYSHQVDQWSQPSVYIRTERVSACFRLW